jgi:hypothetical protein
MCKKESLKARQTDKIVYSQELLPPTSPIHTKTVPNKQEQEVSEKGEKKSKDAGGLFTEEQRPNNRIPED